MPCFHKPRKWALRVVVATAAAAALGRLLLPLLDPASLFLSDTALDPRESDGSPDAGPDKWQRPSDAVGGVVGDGEDQDSDDDGGSLGADTPEQGQSVQHLPEVVACFISGVQSLSELDTTRAVDGDDVFNDPVDARAQLRLGRQRRDTEGSGNTK